MPYCAICLIAECLISGMLYYRTIKEKVGTFKNMPYTVTNAIGGCLIAGFLCISSRREVVFENQDRFLPIMSNKRRLAPCRKKGADDDE